jgi:hypothetical protein
MCEVVIAWDGVVIGADSGWMCASVCLRQLAWDSARGILRVRGEYSSHNIGTSRLEGLIGVYASRCAFEKVEQCGWRSVVADDT